MFGEKISRALDGVSDLQLESAMSVYERKKRIKYIWVRVVAALVVLAVVLFFLQGTASKWMSELDLTRHDFTEQPAKPLLPEETPIGVECSSYRIKPKMEKVGDGELAGKLAECIRNLRLTGVENPKEDCRVIYLTFYYEKGTSDMVILKLGSRGNVYISGYGEPAGCWQLDSAQADYLISLISDMSEQSK